MPIGKFSLSFCLAYLCKSLRVRHLGQGLLVVVLLGVIVSLSACHAISATPVQQRESGAASGQQARLTDIASLDIPLPTTTTMTSTTALVIVKNARANIRSGPGLGYSVVAKAKPGDVFGVSAKSGIRSGGKSAASMVLMRATENPAGWPILWSKFRVPRNRWQLRPDVVPDKLTAQWAVNWQCISTNQNCKVPECSATIDAKSDSPAQQPWQKISYGVTWDKSCASAMETPDWALEVNKYSGQERTQAYHGDFVYDYWAGAQPGAATHVYTMDDGRKVVVHCSGLQTKEFPEQQGWLTVYEGQSCHDIATGLLVTLSYTKQWLYSGKLGDQTYRSSLFW